MGRRRVLRRLGLLVATVVLVSGGVLVVTGSGADTHGARVLRFTIASRFVHRSLPVVAVVPAGAGSRGRPLLVFLHGKDGDQNSELDDAMFAALAQLGPRAPDVVFPYGGPDSYWHDRGDGAWGDYVLREVIGQAIACLHADPRRLASGGESAAGAFDDAEDFARNDVIGAARTRDPYRGAAVWIDVGTEDPFRAADARLAAELRRDGQRVQFHLWPGGHDGSYWSGHWGSYLRFYADALADCRPG